jgi:DNA processing protein
VIEAAEQSGALITAAYALESGRTVCAVPGNITSATSKGCNELLRQGAALISSAADLLQELGCEKEDEAVGEEQMDFSQRSEFVQDREFFRFIGKSPRSEEEIAEFLKKTVAEVQVFLFDLQLEGKIQQQFTGLWGLPAR